MSNSTATDSATTTSFSSSSSTTTFTSDSSTFTSTTPLSSFTSTSTFVTTSYITPSTSSVLLYTSVVTETPSVAGGTASPTTIFITSTASQNLLPSSVYSYSVASSSTASSTKSSALATVGADTSKSSGLSSGGVIAVAVIVPIAAIVVLILGLLYFWKKRKQRKAAEEERKKEIEEYGFNPNHDPNLPPVGAPGNPSEMMEDNSGYRGWGAASSTQRKASTHLSSGRGGAGGAALSDSSSNPGGYAYQGSGTTQAASEVQSGEPLVSPDTMGALVGAGTVGNAVVGRRQSNKEIQRGPSNASSAYSNGRAQSQLSDDIPVPGAGNGAPGAYYHEENQYYSEAAPQHGPYGDGSYGGEQPVIRDVQARRNTRIEKAPAFPQQQGGSGVATNF